MIDAVKNKSLTPGLIRSIIVFSLITVLSIGSIIVSYIYMDEVSQEKMMATRNMRIWQSRIDESVRNNKIIEEFENNFIKLVNQGVVGDEERLSWFETVQNTARKRGMPLVKYSVGSQLQVKEDNIKKEYPNIDVYKSTMTLNVKMGHEGDLFALLNDLEKANGLFAVDKCEIAKISRKQSDKINNMKAYCELGWYTFRRSKKGKS